jgi:protein-tyrosine-phosphatase
MYKKEDIKSVLFVCYLNSIRSPIAEGLVRKNYSNIDVESCGIAAGELDDLMVAIMREVSIDMSSHKSKTLNDLSDCQFDLIIAFTKPAYEAAKAVFNETAKSIEFWPLPDPTQGSLDVRAIMNNYRAIRDNINMRLKNKFIQ